MLRTFLIAALLMMGMPALADDDRDDRREAKREAKEERAERRAERREAKAEKRQAKAERRQAKAERKADRKARKLAKKGKRAKSNICDPLIDSTTPGLYGMCRSYCEARDVKALFAAGKVSAKKAERYAKKQERILARYNETKENSDPDMPCVSETQVCPCWASSQTSPNFWNDKTLGAICANQDLPTMRLSEIGTATSDTTHPEYTRMKALSYSQDNGITFAHYCANEDTATGTSMLEPINETEAIVCATQIQTTCNMLGL